MTDDLLSEVFGSSASQILSCVLHKYVCAQNLSTQNQSTRRCWGDKLACSVIVQEGTGRLGTSCCAQDRESCHHLPKLGTWQVWVSSVTVCTAQGSHAHKLGIEQISPVRACVCRPVELIAAASSAGVKIWSLKGKTHELQVSHDAALLLWRNRSV